jgi:hypothetical protein
MCVSERTSTHHESEYRTGTDNPRPDVIIPEEPEYWREFLNEEHEGSKYSRDGEHEGTSWRELPDHVRTLCLKGLPGWLERTGRVAASAA